MIGKRYELVCDEEELYAVIGYGTICGIEGIVKFPDECSNLVSFLNIVKDKALRILVTEYGGGYDLGYQEIDEFLEDQEANVP